MKSGLQYQSGMSLAEVVVAVGLLSFLALAAATLMSNQQKAAQDASSQASNVALVAAVRTQLARASTCLPNMVTRPTAFANPVEIAVALGPVDTVRANVDLPAWKVGVQSLTMQNFTPAGVNAAGRTVVLGDVVLSAQSRDPDHPFALRQRVVLRLAMEVDAGAVVACYASNALEDSLESLRDICNTVQSSDGVAGVWTGTRCTTPDLTPASTCTYLGGNWNAIANRCYPKHGGTVLTKGADFGDPGGVWYGRTCPTGSRIASGACLSGSGAPPPLNGKLESNGYFCSWPPGYESTQYVSWTACTY